ncbi:MAG: hypothetical protein Q7S65_04135 [Nanoarchaeota archaeon]|nr:hypothetical protein [Nanoarchaeota archaeon]
MDKKRVLSACSQDVAFYLCTGRYVNTLHQLAMSISVLSPPAFVYHVNAQKNDFAKWAQDVFGDDELARRLERTKEKDATVDTILNRLREISS